MSDPGVLVVSHVSIMPSAEEVHRAACELARKEAALKPPRARLANLDRIARRVHGALVGITDLRMEEIQNLQRHKLEIKRLERTPAPIAYQPSRSALREIAELERICSELNAEYEELSANWKQANQLLTNCREWLAANEQVFLVSEFSEAAQ